MADLTKEVQGDFTKKTDFNSLNTKVDKNKTENNNDTTTKTSINNQQQYKATIQSVTAVLNKISDVKGFVKLSDYSTEITKIKNDYVTNTALTIQLNSLKNTHISDEIKKVDDKAKKNSSDILGLESKLNNKETAINELERKPSFSSRFYYFNQQSYLLFEGKVNSFVKTSTDISGWKSTGIFSNDHNDTYPDLKSVSSSNGPPKLLIKNGRFCVDFNGNYMKQDKILYLNFSAIDIYIVYSLDPISNTRNILVMEFVLMKVVILVLVIE